MYCWYFGHHLAGIKTPSHDWFTVSFIRPYLIWCTASWGETANITYLGLEGFVIVNKFIKTP